MTGHIPGPYRANLAQLERLGGTAELDRYGRLTAGPERHILQGDPIAWLWLFAHGLIEGRDGTIQLTKAGKDAI